MNTAWHIAPDLIGAYLIDAVDQTDAVSIEAHLLACDQCRSLLAAHAAAPAAASSWATLERRLDNEMTAPLERLARAVGFNDRDARLLAPNRALRWSWLVAMSVALLSAAALARRGGGIESSLVRLVFLTFAPLVPLVAVVTALGGASEPSAEIAGATASSRLRLGALRALTVLAVSMGIGLVASALLPGSWLDAVVWLCPALALSGIGALAAGRVTDEVAVAGLAMGWVSVVATAAMLTDDRVAAFRQGPQIAYLTIAAAVLVVIALRPRTLELRRVS